MPNNTQTKLSLLFYVKGSRDYPAGQLMSDRYGFDKPNGDGQYAQTAIYSSSIKDVVSNVSELTQIDNIYSLNSDTENGIEPKRDEVSLNFNRTQEYISSIIAKFKNGETLNISPNYDITENGALQLSYSDIKTDSNYANAYSNNLKDFAKTYGDNIFWQKLFTILEFIKHEESNIISDAITQTSSNSIDFPPQFKSNVSSDLESAELIKLKNAIETETSLGKYLGLFIGGSKSRFSTHFETNSSIPDYELRNPYRMLFTYGNKNYSGTDLAEFTEKRVDESLWNIIGLNYVANSAAFEVTPGSNRISYFTFKLQYTDLNTGNTNEFEVKAYFDPTKFINSDAISDIEVWTYNDSDLDKAYDLTVDGFNIRDNDYANLISDNNAVNNNFIVTKDEFRQVIMKEIVDKVSKGYKNYVIRQFRRFTPVIRSKDNPLGGSKGIDSLDWTLNSYQDFYIFYKDAEPSESDIIAKVIDYLKNVHSDCTGMKYDDDGYITAIGHDGHNNSETTEFLARMYPDLFHSIEIHVLPISSEAIIYEAKGKMDKDNYKHPVDLNTIYNTIISYNNFKLFQFSPNGIPVLGVTEQINFPVELVYTGAYKNDVEANQLAFNFPWLFLLKGDTKPNPLTSQTGFADYKQKLFDPNSTSLSNADKLQLILIELAIMMFTDKTGGSSNVKNEIAGISINYSTEMDLDNNVNVGTNISLNVAEFTINSVKFIAHCQKGKSFGFSARN